MDNWYTLLVTDHLLRQELVRQAEDERRTQKCKQAAQTGRKRSPLNVLIQDVVDAVLPPSESGRRLPEVTMYPSNFQGWHVPH